VRKFNSIAFRYSENAAMCNHPSDASWNLESIERIVSRCSSLIGYVYVKRIPIRSEYSVAKHIARIMSSKW